MLPLSSRASALVDVRNAAPSFANATHCSGLPNRRRRSVVRPGRHDKGRAVALPRDHPANRIRDPHGVAERRADVPERSELASPACHHATLLDDKADGFWKRLDESYALFQGSYQARLAGSHKAPQEIGHALARVIPAICALMPVLVSSAFFTMLRTLTRSASLRSPSSVTMVGKTRTGVECANIP